MKISPSIAYSLYHYFACVIWITMFAERTNFSDLVVIIFYSSSLRSTNTACWQLAWEPQFTF